MIRSGRLLTLLAAAGALAVVVLGGVYWKDLAAWVKFYRLFESVGVNEQGLPEYRHRQTGIVMVRVPGGTFLMGTSEEDARSFAESGEEVAFLVTEQPPHEVTLSPFLVAKHEVNQAEWTRLIAANPSVPKGDTLPVGNVSWERCREFCQKAGLSLPSEAQWEYACRAGTSGAYARSLDEIAWYKDNSRGIHPVGEKQPNAFGLHDMRGNVFEWCEDVYDQEFYSRPEAVARDPVAVSGSRFRVVRGGGSNKVALHCRSARRYAGRFGRTVFRIIGFRPAYWPLPPGL